MKLRDEIGDLAAAFGSMAADLKDNQDKLLSYGRARQARERAKGLGGSVRTPRAAERG